MVKNKFVKTILSVAAIMSMSVTMMVSSVAAAPTIVAKVNKNGSLVELGSGETATSTVTLVSDVACTWYSGGQSISDGYSTTKEITKGYGTFTYYCIDQSGNSSNTISVTLDVNQPTVLTYANSVKDGATEVTIYSMKDNVTWYVDGVQKSVGKSITVTGNGKHTVYAKGADGLQSNTLSFSIPFVSGGTTTVTTTTKKPVTTNNKPVTTTSSYKGSTSIALSLKDLAEGGVTNKEVVLEADQNAYFVINGEKQSKAAKAYTITEEGTYTVYATNATNTVNSVTYNFTIDKTAPTVSLKVKNETVQPGVLEDAVTIVTDEVGFFYVNNEQANIREQSELVISESGNYSVEFKDLAGNSSVVNFVVNMPEVTEPAPSNNSSSNGFLYMIGGAVLGGAVVAIIMVIINRKKNEEDDDDEDDE